MSLAKTLMKVVIGVAIVKGVSSLTTGGTDAAKPAPGRNTGRPVIEVAGDGRHLVLCDIHHSPEDARIEILTSRQFHQAPTLPNLAGSMCSKRQAFS